MGRTKDELDVKIEGITASPDYLCSPKMYFLDSDPEVDTIFSAPSTLTDTNTTSTSEAMPCCDVVLISVTTHDVKPCFSQE